MRILTLMKIKALDKFKLHENTRDFVSNFFF